MTTAIRVSVHSGPLASNNARGLTSFRALLRWLDCACATSRIEHNPVQEEAQALQADTGDVTAVLDGDGDAYRRLVQRYQQTIADQMRRFSRDPAVHEELVHDVFVEAWTSLRSYRGRSPWLHWLRRIAVRVGYRYWQRRASEKEITLTDDDWRRLRGELPSANEVSEATDLVYTLLGRLPPADRLVLTLIYLDGCTMAEAAARGGWTVIGTKVRAFRARSKLRKLIEEGTR